MTTTPSPPRESSTESSTETSHEPSLQSTAEPVPGTTAVGSSRRLKLATSAFVVAVAIGGYVWKGAPSLINADPAVLAPRVEADGDSTPTLSQVEAMVARLRERLDNEPANLEGWSMLARSYAVLGRTDDAIFAYGKAMALAPNDAALMADYADVLAMRDGRNLDGEAAVWLRKALEIDPDQPKALALAGTAAFARQDYASAVKAWERVIEHHPDHPFAPQLREAIDEARSKGGLSAAVPLPSPAPRSSALAPPVRPAQPSPVPTPAPAPAATATAPFVPPTSGATPLAVGAAQVSGRVSLAAALASQAGADDTVYVFARAADGPRMPLAVVRKKVRDLPFDFTLDDTMAMTPQTKLSASPKLVIGARISKVGDATPQPGDLQGQVGPVDIGARNVDLVIDRAVSR